MHIAGMNMPLATRAAAAICSASPLVRASGFTEVGVHARHGKLDGTWRDVMLVELLLPRAQ